MKQEQGEKDLFSRFRAWFPDQSEERQSFFTKGLVILDTNVLLNLYRMTPTARNQVLGALEKVAENDRLWLPHHAAQEFVRGRKRAVESRNAMLRKALNDVRGHFQAAIAEVVRARRSVQQVIKDTEGGAETRQHLDKLISDRSVSEALQGWRDELVDRLAKLQEVQDIDPDSLGEADPLLERINELLDGRIGEPLSYDETVRLVDHFVAYRCPNKIPPGFEDEGKHEALRGAGDYLLWEQILRHAEGGAPPSRLLLLVTDDQKTDWRAGDRPRPELAQELQGRAGALLHLETTEGFLEGAREHLGVSVSEETYAEVARAAAAEEIEEAVPDDSAAADETGQVGPAWPGTIDEGAAEDHDPGLLVRDALKASGLVTPAARDSVAGDRAFAWWLVEATATVKRRLPGIDEPEVRLPAAVLADDVSQPDGWMRDRLRVGEGIRNVWVVPWLARPLRGLPAPDRNQLRRLAGERLAVDLQAGA